MNHYLTEGELMEPTELPGNEDGDPDAASPPALTDLADGVPCVACGSARHRVAQCPHLARRTEIELHLRRVELARLAGCPVRQSARELWRGWCWRLLNRQSGRPVLRGVAILPSDLHFRVGPLAATDRLLARRSRSRSVRAVEITGLAAVAAVVGGMWRVAQVHHVRIWDGEKSVAFPPGTWR